MSSTDTVAECSECKAPTKILDEHFFPEEVECECDDQKKEFLKTMFGDKLQ